MNEESERERIRAVLQAALERPYTDAQLRQYIAGEVVMGGKNA